MVAHIIKHFETTRDHLKAVRPVLAQNHVNRLKDLLSTWSPQKILSMIIQTCSGCLMIHIFQFSSAMRIAALQRPNCYAPSPATAPANQQRKGCCVPKSRPHPFLLIAHFVSVASCCDTGSSCLRTLCAWKCLKIWATSGSTPL